MRLQKYLAACGVASRRKCEEIIGAGRVMVNGTVVAAQGVQVSPGDEVRLDGEMVMPEQTFHYVLYHKPFGEVSTASDDRGRPTVLDKFRDFGARLYPVGRLDFDSEGLLLLTNDGELTQKLLHPSHEVEKAYLARISGDVKAADVRRLAEGVPIDGRMTSRAQVRVVRRTATETVLLVTIHEGRNRQVRRMMQAVGHDVLALRRVRFGPLSLGDVKRGAWRRLTEEEVGRLKGQ